MLKSEILLRTTESTSPLVKLQQIKPLSGTKRLRQAKVSGSPLMLLYTIDFRLAADV